MMNLNYRVVAILSLCVLLLNFNNALAGLEVLKTNRGILMCGGNYSELELDSIWNVRNFNATQSIFIKSVIFFDATGTVIYNSTTNSAGIPPTNNGLLGGLDNELQANQSTQFRSRQLVADGLLPDLIDNRRPIQVIIVWSAAEKVVGLDGSLVVISRMLKDAEGPPSEDPDLLGREIGRHQTDCRVIKSEEKESDDEDSDDEDSDDEDSDDEESDRKRSKDKKSKDKESHD